MLETGDIDRHGVLTLPGIDHPFAGDDSQSDEGEFTLRNALIAEGRATTVFAIKLAVRNMAGKLRSGMPMDVYFGAGRTSAEC
jgi:hypothetical protein